MSPNASDAVGRAERRDTAADVPRRRRTPVPVRQAVVLSGLAVGAVVVSAASWAGTPVTVGNVGGMVVVGLSLGAIYAVSASGLVVVYTTTGVFNFAQGAVGMYWAFVYWELRVNRGWPAPVALALVVLVLAPLGGVLLDRAVMRRLRNLPLVLQLMVTVGLMVAFMGIAATQWQGDRGRTVLPFFGHTGSFEVIGVTVTWHRLITILVAAAIALLLRLLLFRARLGVAMRAVVDSRSLAALNGANGEAVSATAWAIGSSLAAVAGILIAPESQLVVDVLTLVVIDAFAAAAVGRMRSLPWTFAGALLLGVGQQFIRRFLSFDDGFANMHEALPTILLFVVVILLPQAQLRARGVSAQLARRTLRLTDVKESTVGVAALFMLVLAWTGGTLPFTDAWSSVGINRGVTMMVTAIIMLSLVPLTGWAGQVSFAPLAFAGVGAVIFAKITGDTGSAYGLVLAAALTAPVGALMALPAVRLQGLYLALASMAFARGFELLFFTQTAVIDPNRGGRQFAPLSIGGWELTGTGRGYLLALTVVFGAMVTGLVALRRSRWGRRWVAMKDSEAAAATLGINVIETKVAVFVLSAAMAGFGGALFGLQVGTLNVLQFELLVGLPIVLLLVVGGVSLPAAALFGGVNTVLFIVIKDRWDYSWLSALEVLGPGIMAVVMVLNPAGAVAEIGRGFARFLPWRADARAAYAAEVAANREPEPGELGLSRPFTAADMVATERALSVANELARPGHDGAAAAMTVERPAP
ncbi:MAG: ABC transporter permease [Acidimicrobiia bacterium]|nr:ABC transporter permease [Acidimicrobiia bacterium]